MSRQLIAPPTVRLAEPADAAKVKAFRCGHRPWYLQDAVKVIRRAASLLGVQVAQSQRMNVLLFELGDRVVALSVLQQAPEPRTTDLVVLAIESDYQGVWLEEEPPRPLCVAVLEESARLAASEGYTQMIAIAADQNKKSLRLLSGSGFTCIAQLDGDYSLYRVTLGSDGAP